MQILTKIKTIEENQTKNLELNNRITELKENQRCSTLYLTNQKKESANSKIDHLKLFSQLEQKGKKNDKGQRKSEQIKGHDNIYHYGSPRMRKKKDKEAESLLKYISENF